MRLGPVALTLIVSVATLAACSSEEEGTPSACLTDASAYLTALADAPNAVRLDGDTAISDCLVEGQSGADLGRVGGSIVEAAKELNDAAREDPDGPATVQLGYLVGAVQQGAADTGGIHADLVRRLDAAARVNPGGGELPVSFERAFGEGYAAGQESG